MRQKNEGSKFMLFLMIWAICILIALMFVVGVLSAFIEIDVNAVFSALSSPWGTMAYQLAVFMLPLALWFAIKREPIKPNFPFAKLGRKNIILIVALSFFLQPIMMLISGISGLFFNNDVAELMYVFQRHPFWLQLIAIAVTPAICEELIFRGYIQSQYRDSTIRKSALINGLFFAMMHLNLQQFAYTFVLGVVFAYMVHYTRSLWAAILPHFIVNGTQVTLGRLVFATAPAYADPQAEELLDALPFSPEVQGVIMLGVIAAVFSPVVIILFMEFVKHNKWRMAIDKAKAAPSQPQVQEYGHQAQANINPMPDWATPRQDTPAAPEWVSPHQGAQAAHEWASHHQDAQAASEWASPHQDAQAPTEWAPPAPPAHWPDSNPSRVDPYAIGVVVIFVVYMLLIFLGS